MLPRLLSFVALLAFAAGAFGQTGLRVPGAPVEAPAVSQEEARFRVTLEKIFECLVPGLPKDWWRAWVELEERGEPAWNERNLEGRFFYFTEIDRTKPQELKTCDAREVAELTFSLNQFLDPEKRRWKAATLEFNRDGSFELKYDYGQ